MEQKTFLSGVYAFSSGACMPTVLHNVESSPGLAKYEDFSCKKGTADFSF